jgi:hypothetical protein
MLPRVPARRSFDYVRHGTSSLFAALELASGTVISSLNRQHRHQEFLQFLDRKRRRGESRDLRDRSASGGGMLSRAPGSAGETQINLKGWRAWPRARELPGSCSHQPAVWVLHVRRPPCVD